MLGAIRRMFFDKPKAKFVLKISLSYTSAKGKNRTEECVYQGETAQRFADLKRAASAVMSWVLTDRNNDIEGGQTRNWGEPDE